MARRTPQKGVRARTGPTHTLQVTELAPGGMGVAHLGEEGERRAVFLRGVLPGEEVEARVDFSKKPARGSVQTLLSESPDRVVPPCEAFGDCGGCDWMHASPSVQKATHLRHVRTALPRAWRDTPIHYHAAPARLGYRTRARLHLASHATGAVCGVHAHGSHRPSKTDQCHVLVEPLERARKALEGLFHGVEGTGEVRLAFGEKSGVVVQLDWSTTLPGSIYSRLETALAQSVFEGIALREPGSQRAAVIGAPTPWMRGADGEPFELGHFAQASEEGNALLANAVQEATGDLPSHTPVCELFSGAGNFSVLLARRFERLTIVELDATACEAARRNLARRGLTAKVVTEDATEFAWQRETKLLVLDPPRSGARRVFERLAEQPAKRVVYVSCDPQTLGRDLAIVEEQYLPLTTSVFELFPQTSHVETVIVLQRKT